MGTNGMDGAVMEEESLGIHSVDGRADQGQPGDEFAFNPLVNQIAFGIARELVAAVKQLEHHVDNEARRLGETVERRLDSLQIDLPELSRFVAEQRSVNGGVQEQLETLRGEARDFSGAVYGRFDSTMAAVQESDSRHAAELAAFQGETRASFQPVWDRIDNICRDLGAQREDIASTQTTLGSMCSRVDLFLERLDRQADAVRSLHSAWSQRDTELDQIVDGLNRLRANPRPMLAGEL